MLGRQASSCLALCTLEKADVPRAVLLSHLTEMRVRVQGLEFVANPSLQLTPD